jgi:pyrrolidone-carboxylate peptidase
VRILVVGFGPFLDVVDNPAGRLARGADGLAAADLAVTGREMPVSYARAPSLTAEWARGTAAELVLGVGVARGRSEPKVERIGRRAADPALADVDGVRLAELASDGADELVSTDAEAVARALRVGLSDDAGAYVCNAWLYRTLRAGLRAAFLHVPPAGLPPERLVAALRELPRALTSAS